jgi:hypothetical protein
MTQAGVATFSSTVNATTFDTNVAAAGVTLAGTTLAADGTDANIDITMTPKGTGTVNPSALSVNSAYTFPTADGNADDVLTTNGAGAVTWEAFRAGGGVVAQRVNASTTAQVTCTTQLPVDDTIPQNTEGDEVLTVTITPTSATNILVIEFTSFGTHTSNTFCGGALFQDSTAGALAAVVLGSDQVESYWNAKLTHYMAAGTTSSTTFKIRCGNYTTPASVWVNGDSGSRKFGGVAATTLCVTEYAVGTVVAPNFTWSVVTANTNMAVNNGYIIKHATPATQLDCTLPTTAAIGDIVRISGYTSGGFKIVQNAGEQIFYGNQATTVGAGGYLESTDDHDSIELMCITADTEWKVEDSVGNFTVV